MERRKLLGHERRVRLRTVRKALYQQVAEKVHPELFQPRPGRNKFVQGFQIAWLSAYAIWAIHLNSGHRFLIGPLFQQPDRTGQVFFYSCNFFTVLVTKSEISATYSTAQNLSSLDILLIIGLKNRPFWHNLCPFYIHKRCR